MRPKTIQPVREQDFLKSQPCVSAFRKSNFPEGFKIEIEAFIGRNIIPDCGRVAPNCLKAHMLKKAKEFGMHKHFKKIKSLFKSKIGYKGYYLDNGKLKRV